MAMTPLVGFAPDLPPTTAGVITDCSHLLPTERGFAAAPDAVAVSTGGALPASCIGSAVVPLIDGTRRIFAGTTTRLYELTGGAWVDRSRGAAYTAGADPRWSFAQFGNATIAANDQAVLQASTSTSFSDIAGAPVAKIVFSVADFVMALNTSDGTYGDQGDRWWCSGIFDHTTWAPSVTTQANTGRLIQGGGDLVAGLALGRQAVAYKSRAMFLGSYVGAPAIWQWDQLPGEQGAVGPDAVCDAGGVHFFVGDDNIWAFDGVRPYPIANDTVRQWFFANSSPTYRYKTIAAHERQNNRVWIFYASNASTGALDSALVYHVRTRAWGRSNRAVAAAMNFVNPGVTIDALTGTIDALTVPFDSQFWLAAGRSLAIFDTSGNLYTLTGSSLPSSFTTGLIGDLYRASRVNRVQLQFSTAPTTSTVSGQIFNEAGGAPTGGGSGSSVNGKYDIRQSGRWHRFTFSHTGAVEFNALDVPLPAAGVR